MIERLAQAPLTRVPHVDEEGALATAFGHRRGAGVGAQRGIIAIGQRAVASVSIVAVTILPTPGKDWRISTSRCSRGSPSAGLAGGQLFQQAIDLPFGREALLMRPRCSCGTSAAMRVRDRLRDARRDRQARLPQRRGTTSSAVSRRMRCARSTAATRRRGSCGPGGRVRRLGQASSTATARRRPD